MKTQLYLRKDRLFDFLNYINERYSLYVPVNPVRCLLSNGVNCDYGFDLPYADYILKEYSSVRKEDMVYNSYRTVEPLKSFFTYPRERITYFQEESFPQKNKNVALFGVKNCDLFSLKIQDFVFLEGIEIDSVYRERRGNTLIISSDCLSFKEVCFCLAYEINPYPESSFDLNFSLIDEDLPDCSQGFLVEIGSERGEKTLESESSLFELASPAQIKDISLKRESLVKELIEHLKLHPLPSKDTLQEIVKKGYESDIWKEKMFACVECGGCNFICGTCHCFLLSDERYPTFNERIRIWDSCQYANFAKVAGGKNPLNTRAKRLRNRFLKKFDFFIDNLGIQACCGCGRCIEVCPGKIDIRKILRELSHEESLSTH